MKKLINYHIAEISDVIDLVIDEYEDETYDITLDIDDDDQDVCLLYKLTQKQVEKIRDVLSYGLNSTAIDEIIKCEK